MAPVFTGAIELTGTESRAIWAAYRTKDGVCQEAARTFDSNG